MPQCFENWCRRFDDVFSRTKQRQGFRLYLGGLLGESQRKNLAQLTSNTVDSSYNRRAALPEAGTVGGRRAEQSTLAGDAAVPSD